MANLQDLRRRVRASRISAITSHEDGHDGATRRAQQRAAAPPRHQVNDSQTSSRRAPTTGIHCLLPFLQAWKRHRPVQLWLC
jgi:hypothetical protein